LTTLLWIEGITDLLALLLLTHSLCSTLRPSGDTSGETRNTWLRDNIHRLVRFGAISYGQHLAILPYGSSPNRLVAGHYLVSAELAAFGFAQTIADLLRRYLPTQLLAGILRPVLIAQYSKSNDFKALARVTSLSFKINITLLGLFLAGIVVSGAPALLLLTGNKYGLSAAILLAGFVLVLLAETNRGLLDIVLQATERNEVLLISNLLLSASLLFAIPLFATVGSLAIVAANLVGLMLTNALIVVWLKHCGFSWRADYRGLLGIAISITIAIALGTLLKTVAPWWAALLATLSAYTLGCWRLAVFDRNEMALLQRLRTHRVTPSTDANARDTASSRPAP
jgi:O-antigen/teichoic acid export membrane protein